MRSFPDARQRLEREAVALTAAAAAGAPAPGVLEQLPDGDRLCHGDFHPANVLVGKRGPVAIDWHRAARGDPMGDLARSRVILAAGFVPPKSPWLVRHLDR